MPISVDRLKSYGLGDPLLAKNWTFFFIQFYLEFPISEALLNDLVLRQYESKSCHYFFLALHLKVKVLCLQCYLCNMKIQMVGLFLASQV